MALLILAASAVPARAANSLPLSKEHKRWLEQEVGYIIADEERKEFLAAQSEADREAIIERFWDIRDPDPSTEVNEFRAEHYARIKYANEAFHEGSPGWKTERGRIYIMHGPPDDRTYVMGGDRLRVTIRNPTELLTGGMTDRRVDYRVEFVRPEAEIWIYRHLEGALSTTGYFQVVFARVDPSQVHMFHQIMQKFGSGLNLSYGARVERDRAILSFVRGTHIGGKFRILYAGEYRFPDIDVFYQSVFDTNRIPRFNLTEFNSAVRDLERSPGEVLYDKIRRGRKLKEMVKARVMFDRFNLSVQFGTVRATSGGTLLPITLGIGSEYEGDTLDVALELKKSDGTSAVDVVHSIKIEPEERSGSDHQNDNFLYPTRLAARPGQYRLLIYGALRDRKATAFLETDVNFPNYATRSLSVSDVLLFDRVIPREEFRRLVDPAGRFLGGTGPLIVKDSVLVPASDARFRRREKLTAFFEVYNPGVGSESKEPSLQVKCRVWQGETPVASVPSTLLDYVTRDETNTGALQRTSYALSVPLLSLDPGDYVFEAEVYDQVLDQRSSSRVSFSVY